MKSQKCILLLGVFLVFFSQSLTGHKTGFYSHETHSSLDNSKWMSSLRDDVLLSSVSLPGTHETLSRGFGGDIAECQTLSLETQLKAGIRVIDVRCRHYENIFIIHHGLIYLHLMFEDVLNTLETYLLENPTETILMRVKEEYESFNVTRTFEETFNNSYYIVNPSLFWNPMGTEKNPRLGHVRGKIVVLDNFSKSYNYGLDYNDETNVRKQDDYKFVTNWDLYAKWEKVKSELTNADASRRVGENYFVFNYLSGSYGAFPFFVASGHITSGTSAPRLSTGLTTITSHSEYPDFPRLDCVLKICTISFEGTNILAMEFIEKRKDLRFVGTIMADFPGDELINIVISINKRNIGHTQVKNNPWTIAFVVFSLMVLFITFCVSVYLVACRKIRLNNASKSNEVKTIPDICTKKYERF